MDERIIEEVKRLVFEVTDKHISDREAGIICQLFPKSPDNPDGYEPKNEG